MANRTIEATCVAVPAMPRTLTRKQLTAALAARQLLLERQRMKPAEAIRRLTPLQGQHSTAPHIAPRSASASAAMRA